MIQATRLQPVLLVFLSLILLSGIATSSNAQEFTEPPVDFEPVLSLSGVLPGDEIILAGVFEIPVDHHLTDKAHGLFYLEAQWPEGITGVDTLWPVGVEEKGEEVYRGTVSIQLKVKASETIRPGTYEVPVSYGYQICRDIVPETCFLPKFLDSSITLQVLEKGNSAIPSSHPVFAQSDAAPQAETVTTAGSSNLEDRLTNALQEKSVVALLLVFIAGILVSFTPCVYPMIPIIIGFVGAGAGGSRAKGFILSVFFVIGLAITYSILGVIAGATGALFGALMANPIVLWFIVAIFVALGASMLGAFDIALPASVQGKLMSSQKQGLIGAVFMGGVTGIVAAPCAGPPLLVLLGWIGKTGNLWLGFILMAIFALGIGVLFIVIGTFAGALTAMPQAGPWMDKIKKGLGVLIFAVALYYLNMLVPLGVFHLVLGVFFILVGIFFGAAASWDGLSTSQRYGKGFGIVLLLAGAFYVLFGLARYHDLPIVTGSGVVASSAQVAGGISVDEDHVAWRVNDYDAVMSESAQSGTPVLIDFYADWCGVCVELDHKVWNQPEVITASEAYIALKLDYTRSTKELEDLRKKYSVAGLPTVLILGSDGNERSRFSSFKTPAEVVSWLEEHK